MIQKNHLLRKESPISHSKDFRANHAIRAPEVMVIDEKGTQLGVLSRDEAIREAVSRGLDLVEVAPQAKPPVCKIADFGALKFRQQKQERKQKARQKKIDVKGIRISLNIGEHDFEIKAARAKQFLEEGHKVKIEIILRGRERAFRDLAISQVEKFQKGIGIATTEETRLSFQGNRISKVITKA